MTLQDSLTEYKQLYLRSEDNTDLADQLPSITNFTQLTTMWQPTGSGSKPEQLIEARMSEVLSLVTLNNTPSWFEPLLKDRNTCPSSLHPALDQVVERMLSK